LRAASCPHMTWLPEQHIIASEVRKEGETNFLTKLVELEEDASAEDAAQGGGGRRSIKLLPHVFMLVEEDKAPILLAALSEKEKTAWLEMLRGFATRSVEAFADVTKARASGWGLPKAMS
jgi:hypothetical protein